VEYHYFVNRNNNGSVAMLHVTKRISHKYGPMPVIYYGKNGQMRVFFGTQMMPLIIILVPCGYRRFTLLGRPHSRWYGTYIIITLCEVVERAINDRLSDKMTLGQGIKNLMRSD